MANGALQITDTNGNILHPTLDGNEVVYSLEIGGETLASIIFEEITGQSVLDIDTSLSLAVADISLRQPAGDIGSTIAETPDGSQAAQQDEVVIVMLDSNTGERRGLLSQDGVTVVKGIYDDGEGQGELVRVFDNVSGQPVNTAIILSHMNKPTTGDLANLPLIPCRVEYDDNNNFVLNIRYQPNQLGVIEMHKTDSTLITSEQPYSGNVYVNYES